MISFDSIYEAELSQPKSKPMKLISARLSGMTIGACAFKVGITNLAKNLIIAADFFQKKNSKVSIYSFKIDPITKRGQQAFHSQWIISHPSIFFDYSSHAQIKV